MLKKTTVKWSEKDEGLFLKRYFNLKKVTFDLSRAEMVTVEYLSMIMGVENNVVIMNNYRKRELAKKSGLKLNTIDHALGSLVKKKIVLHIERGVYKVNPNRYAKTGTKKVIAMRSIIVREFDKTTLEVTEWEKNGNSKMTKEDIKEIMEDSNERRF